MALTSTPTPTAPSPLPDITFHRPPSPRTPVARPLPMWLVTMPTLTTSGRTNGTQSFAVRASDRQPAIALATLAADTATARQRRRGAAVDASAAEVTLHS
ncbi:hypothetical protein ACWEQL_12580 [Kitasatospora sp. NPDC004240]